MPDKPQAAILMQHIGVLDPACAEAQWWSIIVGSLKVPLRGHVPLTDLVEIQAANTGPQQCYWIDVDRLTDEQVEGICKIMSAKYDVPLDEVRDGIRTDHGLPIRADHLLAIELHGRLVI